uniref:Uncharacterized protein n=1 Tax=Arundo donax TaxID=35708 RepID=A0A0A9E3Z1_ARUDO
MIVCASSMLYSDNAVAQSKSNCFGVRAAPLLLTAQLMLDSDSFGEVGSKTLFMGSAHSSLMLPAWEISNKVSSPSSSKACSSS